MSKIVSWLGLLASVAAAIASQVGAINPKAGAYTMLAAAIAAAAGGAITKYVNMAAGAVFLGLVVAVAAVFAAPDFASLLPTSVIQIIGILGTAAAAAGKSLFGWDDQQKGSDPNA